jgi:hypothetical protein
MNQQPVTNKSANADRRVWTQTVFQAEHPSSGEDFIVILTRRTPKDGSTPDLSVRACQQCLQIGIPRCTASLKLSGMLKKIVCLQNSASTSLNPNLNQDSQSRCSLRRASH